MARIVTGNRPQIETKTYAREYSSLLMMESRGEIEEEIAGAAQRAGVPAEASLNRETDRQRDVTVFTWRWWEITLP